MLISIDPSVTFEFQNNRKATVDAYELAEFRRSLFEQKGMDGADGSSRTLDWAVIVGDTTAWMKQKANIDLTPAEAIGVFEAAIRAWDEKKRSWGPPAAASPTSPPSTDPRYSD